MQPLGFSSVDGIPLGHLRSDYDFTRILGNVIPGTFPVECAFRSFNSSVPIIKAL